MKQKYYVDAKWNGNYNTIILWEGEIELDDAVIANVDDSWKRTFYNFTSEHEIVDHIAFNMVVNELKLSQIDGFANLSDDLARII